MYVCGIICTNNCKLLHKEYVGKLDGRTGLTGNVEPVHAQISVDSVGLTPVEGGSLSRGREQSEIHRS